MGTLFLSDLHLDERRPDTINLAMSLIDEFAPRFDALYILGDFVEYWIGDDYCHPEIQKVFDALSQLSASGIVIHLMHGNRDFLISSDFAKSHGIDLYTDDEVVIDLYGVPTLIMHGDTLCSDDVDYQVFRKLVRSVEWQSDFLAKPVQERLAVVNDLRENSQRAIQEKTVDIMDVNSDTVSERMRQHGVERLIHGHTHRPATHVFDLDGAGAARFVLGEWTSSAKILVCSTEGCELIGWPEVRKQLKSSSAI